MTSIYTRKVPKMGWCSRTNEVRVSLVQAEYSLFTAVWEGGWQKSPLILMICDDMAIGRISALSSCLKDCLPLGVWGDIELHCSEGAERRTRTIQPSTDIPTSNSQKCTNLDCVTRTILALLRQATGLGVKKGDVKKVPVIEEKGTTGSNSCSDKGDKEQD